MRIFLLVSFSLFIANCFAQIQEASLKDNYEKIYQYAKEKYKLDQQLINGSYFEYKYKYAKGHPFIFANEFTQGDLVFRATDYKGVYLKYDIFEQSIIIMSNLGNSYVTSILPNEFLSEFTFSALHFEKHSFNMDAPAYYQVVAKTEEIACYYHWYKTRQESTHNITFISYEFSKDRHKSYILFNEKLRQFKNKQTYVTIFPAAIQKELMSYLRIRKIKVKEISDEEMLGIIQYTQSLLEQNTSHKFSL